MRNRVILLFLIFVLSSCGPSDEEFNKAISSGNIDLIKNVLSRGYDLNKTNNDENPLIYAVTKNNREIVKLLLEYNISPFVKLKDGTPVIFHYLHDMDIMKIIVNNQNNLINRDEMGYTLLARAVENENVALLKLLIEKGVNVNDKVNDRRGFSPLMFGVEAGNFEIVKLLINNGADINALDAYGDIPLLYVLGWKNEDDSINILNLLLKNGLDINVHLKDGVTPLHSAARSGNIEYVKFLLENGANPNVRDNYGNLPIDYCTYITKNYSGDVKIPEENYTIRKEVESLLNEYMEKK